MGPILGGLQVKRSYVSGSGQKEPAGGKPRRNNETLELSQDEQKSRAIIFVHKQGARKDLQKHGC